jgi:UDP-N-acetylglucosamine--N-acetylmuramyl-(pentapeptide) pyrophosphoryl-undecaprenol N-acetylglucosamine transferase
VGNQKHSIYFAGGGTGGHLYPALAVAEALRDALPQAVIRFIGAQRGIEQRLVPQAGYPLLSLRISGLKGRGRLSRVAAVLAAGWAVIRCLLHFLRSRPDLVIGVGGYASGPAMLAARIVRVPTMILEQNHFPGATNRWLAPRVDAVCVPSEDAQKRLGGIGVVTGNPVRREFFEAVAAKSPSRPTLLIFGGSRGARSINRAVVDALETLARLDNPPKIVHQTGETDYEEVRSAIDRYPASLYEVCTFLDDMPVRLAAADLVVCRAGASTLSELTAAGRPAILVPYPHAADDHQRHNAESLATVGAALVVPDADLDGARLAGLLEELLSDGVRLSEMGGAARTLAIPDATDRIVEIAQQLLKGGADVS